MWSVSWWEDISSHIHLFLKTKNADAFLSNYEKAEKRAIPERHQAVKCMTQDVRQRDVSNVMNTGRRAAGAEFKESV